MMLTEAEAATRWCPFSRYAMANEPSSNRWKQSLPVDEPHALNPVPCRCIGSACMAWRWFAQYEDTRTGEAAKAGSYPPGVLEERGFCGLAGLPT